MKILSGKKIAQNILNDLQTKINQNKLRPGLAVIFVGQDKASELYIRLKKEAAKKVGINFSLFKFSENDSESKIINKIKKLNKDKKINGIIVQLPLPKKYKTQKIINCIASDKDVDGFTPENIKLFLKGEKIMTPVFPGAITKLTISSGQRLAGKYAVVIVNSQIFGKVMVKALEKEKIKAKYILKSALTPTLSRRERGIAVDKIKKADILITAVGEPGSITGEIIKRGAIVIDGGITQKGKKVLGDIDFNSMKNIAGYISPVPGGVGPVTVATLLENVYHAFWRKN